MPTETSPISINYIFVGPPTIQFLKNLNSSTSNRPTTAITSISSLPSGHDTKAPMQMAKKLDPEQYRVNFWCLDEHEKFYEKALSSKIYTRPIRDYLSNEKTNPKLKQPEIKSAADKVLQVMDTLLKSNRNRTRDRVTVKNILSLFLLMCEGDYVMDSNVRPSEEHKLNLPRYDKFYLPYLSAPHNVIEVWMMYSPLNHPVPAAAFNYFYNAWLNAETIFAREGYSANYHKNMGIIIVSAVAEGCRHGSYDCWRAPFQSCVSLTTIGVNKYYFNTHKFGVMENVPAIFRAAVSHNPVLLKEAANEESINLQVNTEISANETPLHWALENKNLPAVQFLLTQGARIDLAAKYKYKKGEWKALDLIEEMPKRDRSPYLSLYIKSHPETELAKLNDELHKKYDSLGNEAKDLLLQINECASVKKLQELKKSLKSKKIALEVSRNLLLLSQRYVYKRDTYDISSTYSLMKEIAATPSNITRLRFDTNLSNEENDLPRAFAAIPKWITHLMLSSTSLHHYTHLAQAIAAIPTSIKILDLNDNGLGIKPCEELGQIFRSIPASITDLNLGNTRLHNYSETELTQIFANLTAPISTLSLFYTGYPYKGLRGYGLSASQAAAILRALPRTVTKLNLAGNSELTYNLALTFSAIPPFVTSLSLRGLNLVSYSCNAKAFSQLPASLTCLSLGGNQLAHKSVRELITLFRAIPMSVTDLDLEYNDYNDSHDFSGYIGDISKGFVALSESITTLKLGYNKLGRLTGCQLHNAFARLPRSIINLQLDHNDLGEHSEADLSQAFASMPRSVTTLNLSWNDLRANQLISIFSSLPNSVTYLNLQGNSLCKQPLIEIVRAIRAIPLSVKHLDISYTLDRGGDAQQIAQMFAAIPPSITYLDIGGNDSDVRKRTLSELCDLVNSIPVTVTHINCDDDPRIAELVLQIRQSGSANLSMATSFSTKLTSSIMSYISGSNIFWNEAKQGEITPDENEIIVAASNELIPKMKLR